MGNNNRELFTRREVSKMQGDIMSHQINKSKNKNEISEDSKYRKEINSDIIRMISEGKGKVETLAFLNNKYPNSKFSKFFVSWFEHHKERENIKRKRPFEDYVR